MSKMASSNVHKTATKGRQKIIVPDFQGATSSHDSKKSSISEVGASHYSADFSRQILTPTKDWKFSFGKHKNIQLQDAIPTDMRPWCRWLVSKLAEERPISGAYAQAYLDNKTYPAVCDWSKNEHPFLTIGKYKGFPLNMIHQEHPTYFNWLLSSNMASSLSDVLKDYIKQHFVNE
jgi:hypothetical protein